MELPNTRLLMEASNSNKTLTVLQGDKEAHEARTHSLLQLLGEEGHDGNRAPCNAYALGGSPPRLWRLAFPERGSPYAIGEVALVPLWFDEARIPGRRGESSVQEQALSVRQFPFEGTGRSSRASVHPHAWCACSFPAFASQPQETEPLDPWDWSPPPSRWHRGGRFIGHGGTPPEGRSRFFPPRGTVEMGSPPKGGHWGPVLGSIQRGRRWLEGPSWTVKDRGLCGPKGGEGDRRRRRRVVSLWWTGTRGGAGRRTLVGAAATRLARLEDRVGRPGRLEAFGSARAAPRTPSFAVGAGHEVPNAPLSCLRGSHAPYPGTPMVGAPMPPFLGPFSLPEGGHILFRSFHAPLSRGA
eukprot:scaffold610_cov352-Pavlova_lutheri.AAC.19